jgi:molybdate transport system ATP-binding protein
MDLELSFEKKWGSFTLHADMIYSGQRLGIFGPSGCGKSTLAHVLAGLIPPDRGNFVLDGLCLDDQASGKHAPPEKRRLGLVFQKAHLLPHLSVRENLLYGYRRVPPDRRRLLPGQVISRLDLALLLNRAVTHLSGGEQQRVAIGRAVLASPQLLIFDEPVAALDEETRYKTMRYIRELCQACSIPYIYISHSVLEMRLMTDDVMLMTQGRIQQRLGSEELARQQAGASPSGYCNLLPLVPQGERAGLWNYAWGKNELVLTHPPYAALHYGMPAAKDIVLFKDPPRAISARNLIQGRVQEVIAGPATCGVVMDCQGERLTAEVVHAAVKELQLTRGETVHAAIKASAFRILP